MAATIAAAAAVIAPTPTLWKHAPRWLVFSLPELLTALALVCLVGTVASMFPFTWHLLIRSEQIELVKEAINSELQKLGDPGDTGAHALDTQVAQSHVHEAHHGLPASWAASSIVIIGFIVGGIALPIGPTWWLFWTGVGMVVLGAIVGAAANIFDDWY
jgi:hypothetical protein